MENIPITGHTQLTGLLGSPVAHSLSPLMHNTAFRLLGLDYVYLCFEVTEDRLPEAVKGLKVCGIRGFNLTMPNKNRMLDLLDSCTPAARLIGAVNTVVHEGGKLIGYNTDGVGFLRSLEEAGTGIKGKKMVLLGAGGAASAIAVQTALDGASELRIFLRRTSRFYERTVQLADALKKESSCRIELFDMADGSCLRDALGSADVLVNATPVGMEPETDCCLIPDADWLPPALTVADIIYHPQKTRLLMLAEQAGCRTCPGLGMLVHQGAEAFRLWTGREMPLDRVREITGLAPGKRVL